MKYFIRHDVSNEQLIDQYGFKPVPHLSKTNLEYRDENRAGLQIWWADKSVHILLGDHATYGIAPIPDILIQMIKDGIIVEGEVS